MGFDDDCGDIALASKGLVGKLPASVCLEYGIPQKWQRGQTMARLGYDGNEKQKMKYWPMIRMCEGREAFTPAFCVDVCVCVFVVMLLCVRCVLCDDPT